MTTEPGATGVFRHQNIEYRLTYLGGGRVTVAHPHESTSASWALSALVKTYPRGEIEWDEPDQPDQTDQYVCANCNHSWERHVDGEDDMVVCDCFCMDWEIKL